MNDLTAWSHARLNGAAPVAEHAKEIGPMPAIGGNLGLCSTCNNAPTCFHRARRGPALFCELFDGSAPPVEWTSRERVVPSAEPSMARRAPEEEVSEYSGLCVNCEHRQTCTHPKPEGGVWHCEDYE